MNRNVIKYLAIIAMLCDHIAMIFLNPNSASYIILRTFGRITGPLMCYFLVEGFKYTSSKQKYLKRLLIFALISQIPFMLATKNWFKLNMIFTLFLCACILIILNTVEDKMQKILLCAILTTISIFCDWGLFAPLMVIAFYVFSDSILCQILAYYLITIVAAYGNILEGDYISLGMILVVPLILLYNKKPGRKNKFNKWFFYCFYPAHLLILSIINLIL